MATEFSTGRAGYGLGANLGIMHASTLYVKKHKNVTFINECVVITYNQFNLN